MLDLLFYILFADICPVDKSLLHEKNVKDYTEICQEIDRIEDLYFKK